MQRNFCLGYSHKGLADEMPPHCGESNRPYYWQRKIERSLLSLVQREFIYYVLFIMFSFFMHVRRKKNKRKVNSLSWLHYSIL